MISRYEKTGVNKKGNSTHSCTINITHVTIIACIAYNNYVYYNTIRLTKVPLVCLQGLFIYFFIVTFAIMLLFKPNKFKVTFIVL